MGELQNNVEDLASGVHRDAAQMTLADLKSQFTFELWPIDRVTPNPANARTHSEKQIAKLAVSIARYGLLSPLVVDEGGVLIAGHGRHAALKQLGLPEVPVVLKAHLSRADKIALSLADNRLAELAGWDKSLLRIQLAELSDLDLDFDVEITGFDTVDLDALEEGQRPDSPEDAVPAIATASISGPGDVWQMGRHVLLCGDAREKSSYAALMGEKRCDVVFTDPPYNVRINGHASTTRGVFREFPMASGEMTPAQYTEFLKTVLGETCAVSQSGSIHFICMDWRHQPELSAATECHYGRPRNLCVWVKDAAGMGTFYRGQHELVYVFKYGSAPHVNNFGLGGRGRYRTNVWNYPSRRAQGAEYAHPTMKPVALVMDALRDCSQRRALVLDPFGGSGTTLIAAEKTQRAARLIEIDPLYCDVIVRRWQALTGNSARRLRDSLSFSELEATLSPADAQEARSP